MEEFFNNMIVNEGLIDVEPTIMSPTWNNGRARFVMVAKHLDRILVSEKMVYSAFKMRS